MKIRLEVNTADADTVLHHLALCDASFAVPLSERVNLAEYAVRLTKNATMLEAWLEDELVGLVAYYENPEAAHVSNVSVLPELAGQGTGKMLMQACIARCRSAGVESIMLEVQAESPRALALYGGLGFSEISRQGAVQKLNLKLK